MVIVKALDLKFKYRKYIETRDEPKFQGTPDSAPFNRDDLYEVLPMLGAVMDQLGSDDGEVLNRLEDFLNTMPRFIITREETFNYLVGCGSQMLQGY